LVTIQELIVALGIALVVLIISMVIINPAERMRMNADEVRKQEMAEIDKALDNYVQLSEDGLPTYDNGNALPTVTSATVITQGIDLAKLDNLSGEYLSHIPLDPSGNSYKVGVISGSSLIIGIALSDGSPYTL
jgi:type II secretory pathway component PulM